MRGGQVLGKVRRAFVTHAPTEDAAEGYPIGESCRRAAVLGLMTRNPGAEANLVGPPGLALSPCLHLRLRRGGLPNCLPTYRVRNKSRSPV